MDIKQEPNPAQMSAHGMLVMSMLALDALALRVIEDLKIADVSVLLMKGPVTSQWLFSGDPLGHVYTDVDLLVAPSDRDLARGVLLRAGFRDHHADVLGIYRPRHETAWVSPTGVVDLHHNLWGIPESYAGEAWREFSANAQDFILHGRSVRTLGTEARVLQLTLHAAHAGSGEKAVRDLQQARRILGEAPWRDAFGLAERLGAAPAFAAGLSCLEGSEELIGRPGEQWSPTAMTYLSRRRAMPEALAVARLHEAASGERWRMVSSWFSLNPADRTIAARVTTRAKALGRLPFGVLQWAWAVAMTTRQRARRP